MNTYDLPSYLKVVFTESDIREAVVRIGKEITSWAGSVERGGGTVIAVPVLKGGVFFFADLVRAVTRSLEVMPVKAWGYAKDVNNKQLLETVVDTDGLDVRGRHLLLIDDVCDSGRTLETLYKVLLEQGAAEVRSAVLIKRVFSSSTFNPDWVGVTYNGEEWFVGYGMNDKNRWRNLPSVYIIQK